MGRLDPSFERNVFINCPFDSEYAPIFEAIVFAVHDAGFRPRCARERLDSSEIRLQKIIFQKYLSDIGGQDVLRHGNSQKAAVSGVRDWLRSESEVSTIPSGSGIYERYVRFRDELPDICSRLHLDVHNLTFVDLSYAISGWLSARP